MFRLPIARSSATAFFSATAAMRGVSHAGRSPSGEQINKMQGKTRQTGAKPKKDKDEKLKKDSKVSRKLKK
jgi:hypothetical protein